MGESAVGLSVPASPPAPADGITWPVLGATKYTWQTEGAPKGGEKKKKPQYMNKQQKEIHVHQFQ